jgi:hypothetical protein
MKTSTLLLILFSINLVACLGDKAPEETNTEETPISIISNLNNCSSQPPSTTGLAPYQIVYDGCIAWNGDTGTAVVRYISNEAGTTGLGIRVHYDSASLTLIAVADVLQDKIFAAADVADIKLDKDNDDNDDSTDKKIEFSWADLTGVTWPGMKNADLVTLTFSNIENGDGNYYLNFTSTSTAAGYQFNP